MAKENYFDILGLNRDAGDAEIRKAYKNLVLKYHPDRGSQCDAERFLKVQEAYATLCDPEKRRRYLRELERNARRESPSVGVEPVRLQDFWETAHPFESYPDEPFFGDWFALDLDLGFSGSPAGMPPRVEVILSPQEARSGARIPLEIPVRVPCNRCRGTGGTWLYPCTSCGGSGIIASVKTVSLDIPPGLSRDTSVNLTVSDRDGFVQNLTVVLKVRVWDTG